MRIDLLEDTEIQIHKALFDAIDPEEEFDCSTCKFYREETDHDEFGNEQVFKSCRNTNHLLCEIVYDKLKEAVLEINKARKNKGMKVSELFV